MSIMRYGPYMLKESDLPEISAMIYECVLLVAIGANR